MFYLILTAAVIGAIFIAWAIQTYVIDPKHCDRLNRGYNCHGKTCEGCYHNLPDGTREYVNDWPYSRPNEAKSIWQ